MDETASRTIGSLEVDAGVIELLEIGLEEIGGQKSLAVRSIQRDSLVNPGVLTGFSLLLVSAISSELPIFVEESIKSGQIPIPVVYLTTNRLLLRFLQQQGLNALSMPFDPLSEAVEHIVAVIGQSSHNQVRNAVA